MILHTFMSDKQIARGVFRGRQYCVSAFGDSPSAEMLRVMRETFVAEYLRYNRYSKRQLPASLVAAAFDEALSAVEDGDAFVGKPYGERIRRCFMNVISQYVSEEFCY